MAVRFFVTGTDTEVGKTLVSCALLHLARGAFSRTLGLKPLASGAQQTPEGLHNEDALALRQASLLQLPYSQHNPQCFAPAIAPHLAAKAQGLRLSVGRLAGFVRGAWQEKPDFCVLEGAGGWRVPLNEREYLSDLARELACPVILVVGLRLGCINHSVLTAEAIRRDGLNLAGWVATSLSADLPEAEGVMASLTCALPAPCLGWIPHLAAPTPEQAAADLQLPPLP
jgi:dethiobiotin synthetase